MSEARPRALLCVGGGIAAYKAPEIVRALIKEGCEVRVLITAAAGAFVSELSLASVSGHPVRSRLLDASEEGTIGHIELADWADVVVVAPGTADLMARAAHGLADDLVTCVLLATRAPILWAPAMNTNMWRHPATQANLATLAERGAQFVGPDAGELACGWIGEGRMIDPPVIAAAAAGIAARRRNAAWVGRRVLVSAGPTRTYIDPVRFIANASTGAMGFALADAAARLGAQVTLVAGPVERPTPFGVERVDVETAEAMRRALVERLDSGDVDLVAMVAAVGDLALAEAPQKLAKAELLGRLAALEWRVGVDILATLVADYPGVRFLGFAAQTVADGGDVEAELVRLGEAKLAAKGADAIFVNRVGVPGLGFASSTNAGALIMAKPASPTGPRVFPSGPPIAKPALARWILDRLGEQLWAEAGEGRGA
ncbi:MAG: bifunctional phosphopantothenoylcysteine decarboxylase/phosphopantothenate--cysteine ligase CoaBC [Nannocystaceae bacterium]